MLVQSSVADPLDVKVSQLSDIEKNKPAYNEETKAIIRGLLFSVLLFFCMEYLTGGHECFETIIRKY